MNVLHQKLRFEPGDISDLDEIMVIEQASFAFPWSEGMILSELFGNPSSASIVVRAGEAHDLLAYAFMREMFDELHLLSVAVDPKWRRRGVAAELIRRVLSCCQEKGMSRVILEVRASNRPAQILYQKFGFRQVGLRRNYYCRPTENALLFQYDMLPEAAPTGVLAQREVLFP